MKQLVISLFVVLAVMIAVFAAQQYIPSGSVQNNEPEIPISESELDMLDQPIFWLYDFSSDVIPTGNPFRLYERVYPAAGFELLQGSEEFNLLASNGGVVIDMTRDHIRLLFDDGSISTYAKAWFISKDADLDRGAVDHELYWGWNWLVGNQFEFGDTICSVSDSLGGTFPNKSIVWKVDGDFVYVLGHSGPIDFTHFQNCVK